MTSEEKSVQMRALKDWLDVNDSVRAAVDGIVGQGATLTADRIKAILDGMGQLQEQTERLRKTLTP